MRQREAEIDALGAKVAVVTFENDFFVRAYVRETNLPWPILIDASRQLYGAYGMERGRLSEIVGLRSWAIYAKLLLKGRRLRRSTGDVFQLGGDVLVDPQGVVRLHHVGRGPADRPEVDAILDVVRSGSSSNP